MRIDIRKFGTHQDLSTQIPVLFPKKKMPTRVMHPTGVSVSPSIPHDFLAHPSQLWKKTPGETETLVVR